MPTKATWPADSLRANHYAQSLPCFCSDFNPLLDYTNAFH